MAEKTSIAWCDATWNPWIGCTKVASGCANCYAEADFAIRRKRVVWGPHGTRVKTSDDYWRKPIKWNREAGENRLRVFPSLCDVFEDWGQHIAGHQLVLNHKGETLWRDEVSGQIFAGGNARIVGVNNFRPRYLTLDHLRSDMFQLIDNTPNLDWLLLSKRPENILRMWPTVKGRPYVAEAGAMNDYQLNRRENVWLIYSASDQESLEAGLPHLLKCRDLVPVLGLSLEPLLGTIDLSSVMDPIGIDYVENIPACLTGGSELSLVIVGGESGPNARPCALEWIDDIRRQCATSGVHCFVKQMGSNPVTENANVWDFDYLGKRIGAGWGLSAAGCRINFDDPKGGNPAEWPEDLRVQELPNATR